MTQEPSEPVILPTAAERGGAPALDPVVTTWADLMVLWQQLAPEKQQAALRLLRELADQA